VFRFPGGARDYPLLRRVQNGSGAQSAHIQYVTWGHSPGIKRSGRESDHWPSSSARANNEWSYDSTTPYAFIECTDTNLLLLFISLPILIKFYIMSCLLRSLYTECIYWHLLMHLSLTNLTAH
jgi:hypothetical protein